MDLVQFANVCLGLGIEFDQETAPPIITGAVLVRVVPNAKPEIPVLTEAR